jgi:hypothetical protein
VSKGRRESRTRVELQRNAVIQMRIDPIEQKVLRAVGITLAVVAVVVAGVALTGRYQVFTEHKRVEEQREYEQEMARLMEEELVTEGMTTGVVRATLGLPDSIMGIGELSQAWYYQDTRNYGSVLLRFEHDLLVEYARRELQTEIPPPR